MSRMANPKDVMKRATELRLKQGMSNSDAMKQAWAEARATEAEAKAKAGGK